MKSRGEDFSNSRQGGGSRSPEGSALTLTLTTTLCITPIRSSKETINTLLIYVEIKAELNFRMMDVAKS